MQETGKTKGWFTVGMTLIVLGGGIYGLLTLFGVQILMAEMNAASGQAVWPILLIPGLVCLGFLVLLAKVIVDRLNNAEDDHYSKTVDK
ncbi:MAG: hypothetical protein AAFO74_05715 [Pseudomonadota bacterium]